MLPWIMVKKWVVSSKQGFPKAWTNWLLILALKY